MVKVGSKIIENEVKEQKDWFFLLLLVTLCANLLGAMLSGTGVFELVKEQLEQGRIFNDNSLLTNFEILKYQNEPIFNGVYLWNNLPKIKGGAYTINLYEHKLVATHWKALYVYDDNVTNW